MERPIQKPIGTRAEEVDTPALVLDIDRFEANLAKRHPAVRANVSLHRCPAIASRQIAAGARGVFVWSLSEAEMLAQQGFDDIAVGVTPTTAQKKARAAAIARQVRLTFEKDEPTGASDLDGAVKVLATVISRPEPGLAILDMGQKAISSDLGMPSVDGLAGARVSKMSAEHGFLASDGPLPGIGEKVWLAPADLGVCMNLHDYVSVVRGGRLEAVWEISLRGLYR